MLRIIHKFRRSFLLRVTAPTGAVFLFFASSAVASSADWPQFRGPAGSGVSLDPAPVVWNIESRTNLRWEVKIAGLGHASPIVWSNRVYIATAVNPANSAELRVGLYGDGDSANDGGAQQWRLLCLDKATGAILWNKLGHESAPRLKRHTKASHCNSTPATDGARIVAIFGSEGLFCFDMDGKLLWRKDLGKMDAGPYNMPSLQWGFAGSPILHDGKVVVHCDVLSEQFLSLFDAKDGRELWRTPRKDVASWSTPALAKTPDGWQIVVNGWKQIGGYDFETGKELWRLAGGGDIPVPMPVVAENMVFLTSGHGKYRPMRAIRLDAKGDITPPEMEATNRSVVWVHPRQGNYLQTPIVANGLLWGCHDTGVLTCFDAHTGKIHYSERLGGGGQGFSASPVAANGKLYVTGEQGTVFVLPATEKFSVLATNTLGDICLATPALSQGTLFFRTQHKVLSIGFGR